jgi:peptidoglycan/xylan/chitin deacetylase (PgdA/CDA1 family)
VGIPVLLYHSVGENPSGWIAPFTVSRATLERHLDLVVASGRTPVTLSMLRDGVGGLIPLPSRPVVITFDDGFADTLTVAGPVLARHGVVASVYLTSGFMAGRSPGGDRMLDWSQVDELAQQGHEIGAHSVTHPQLDTLSATDAWRETSVCKQVLEDRLGTVIRSFAYPHGYSSPRVRQLVAAAGYDSACAVKNALSSVADPQLSVARLMLTASTSDDTVRQWLAGGGARVGRRDGRAATRAWRTYRRTRSLLTQNRSRP